MWSISPNMVFVFFPKTLSLIFRTKDLLTASLYPSLCVSKPSKILFLYSSIPVCIVFQCIFPRPHLWLGSTINWPVLWRSLTLMDKPCSRIHWKPWFTCILRSRHLKYSCWDIIPKLLHAFAELSPITCKSNESP